MALTVIEASDRFANFKVNPAPLGPGVCPQCRGFPSEGYTVCHGCSVNPNLLDAFAAITYSLHLEQMHTELRGYKEDEYPASVRSHFGVGLTAVLWRFLALHEACIARAAGVRVRPRRLRAVEQPGARRATWWPAEDRRALRSHPRPVRAGPRPD